MVSYMKHALLLAYSSDQELYGSIDSLESIPDICKFVERRAVYGEEIYFVCDQMNALDHNPAIGNTLDAGSKPAVMSFICQLGSLHNFIWSASGNCENLAHDNFRQNSGAKHLLFRRGFTRVYTLLLLQLSSFSTNVYIG